MPVRGETCEGSSIEFIGYRMNESAENFQNYDSRRLLTFFCGGWYLHKEKQTSFLTLCKANFGMTVTVTSLFEIWTPAWSFPGSSSLHEGIVFFS